MFSEIGKLSSYWHVIALARELKRGKSLKRSLYGRSLLLWRDTQGELHALLDCCAHKKAPVEVVDYRANRIVCPYHGWEYDQHGRLIDIPSSPAACEKLNCKIGSFVVTESDGFIWVSLNQDGATQEPIPDLSAYVGDGWGVKYKAKSFQTTEELLIDNFMDATHTASVHDGLIRSSQNSVQHELTVTTDQNGVRVDFAEQEERVGPGLNLLLGSSMKVKHSDEFLFPNLVRVVYEFNGVPRFMAFIACTPLSGGKTLALIQLRYKFGWPNLLIGPLLPLLAGKILRQDFDITQKQYANRQQFSDLQDHPIAQDYIPSRVSQLRKKLVDGETEIVEHVKQIELSV